MSAAGPALPIDALGPLDEATCATRIVAGRRAHVVVGPSIDLLAPPLRLARDLRMTGPADEDVATRVSPLGLERIRRRDGARLIERIAVPHDLPAAFIEWESDAPIRIEVGWDVDLRLDPTFPAGACGDLDWNAGDGLVTVRSAAGDRTMFSLSSTDAALRVDAIERDGRPAVRCSFATALSPGTPLRLTARALLDGARMPASPPNAVGLVRARAGMVRRVELEQMAIATPEPAIDAAFARARNTLREAIVEFPGIGRAHVPMPTPGLSGTGAVTFVMAPAFDAAAAALALGDFASVRDLLAMAGALQDITGALPATCTATAIGRYDGDRATALYLLLLARYAAWSGDLGFVGEAWRRVGPALAY
jgi:hypothetical protein